MADLVYGNANIIMQSASRLLTRRRIREMVAAPDRTGVLAVLAECGYQTDLPDDTALLHAERVKTLNTFLELCPDPYLATAVTALDQMTESNALAQFATIANAVPHLKNAAIREYFTTLADLTNVRTYYKGGQTMVAGGTRTGKDLNLFPDLTVDAIQSAIDARLDALAAVDKDDIFQPNPLFWWYHQKQKEFTVVKTILAGKRFGYDAATLRTSLRGLYEQFA